MKVCEIRACFAPVIFKTTFAGILATVNGQKLISIARVSRHGLFSFLCLFIDYSCCRHDR